MDNIEKRAKKHFPDILDDDCTIPTPAEYIIEEKRQIYILGATEQKAIDDEELLKLKSSWEKGVQINHDDEASYKQGYHDATKKACELLKAVGVLRDDDSIMGFIKAMEE